MSSLFASTFLIFICITFGVSTISLLYGSTCTFLSFSTNTVKSSHFNDIGDTKLSVTVYSPYGKSSIIQYPFSSVCAVHFLVNVGSEFNIAVNSHLSNGNCGVLLVAPISLYISISFLFGSFCIVIGTVTNSVPCTVLSAVTIYTFSLYVTSSPGIVASGSIPSGNVVSFK